ncbi:SDR family NAD(P)-dependent oxidoreductase [Maritimibacter alexandrii]|jgi:3-oxoacyl-[acyl-carrier protein] reductase|uniref:SDR family NAD(P)-dependent oxidoreductase n=1 Tax=Maritimibacter alexandrii TaxID=2570355 RepID=UPI0011097729|nr:SDR family oxidoreductase [Maritimibacter alexandrii]
MSRVALVTGAARGIGATTALRLADDGNDIAVLDLTVEACEQTVADVEARGRKAVAVAADVSNPEAAARAVAEVTDRLGTPTVLVNNAGLLREGTLRKTSSETWNSVLDVNLAGAFNMAQAVQMGMRAERHGRIVNITSTGALGATGLSAYSAAKSGLHGLTKSLAIELGRFGITVNAVAPGLTLTTMIDEMSGRTGEGVDAMTEDALKSIPVGRLGTPDDIAHAISFFTDPRSDFVSGQILYVTGGPKC